MLQNVGRAWHSVKDHVMVNKTNPWALVYWPLWVMLRGGALMLFYLVASPFVFCVAEGEPVGRCVGVTMFTYVGYYYSMIFQYLGWLFGG